MELLELEVVARSGWRVVTASGQLDVATAPRMRELLQAQQYEPGRRLVIDLAGLEFLDSFGLGVLVGGLRRARAGGGRLVLAATPARIAHVLAITGLDTVFELSASVAAVVEVEDG